MKKRNVIQEAARKAIAKVNGLVLPSGVELPPVWFQCDQGHKFDMRKTAVIQAVWKGEVARLCPACLFFLIKGGYELKQLREEEKNGKAEEKGSE